MCRRAWQPRGFLFHVTLCDMCVTKLKWSLMIALYLELKTNVKILHPTYVCHFFAVEHADTNRE
jgi:hypothetical protein